MVMIGADSHKRTHTVVALDEVGRRLGTKTVRANSEVRNSTTFGVLKLTLSPDGYAWQFVPAGSGTFRDSGSGTCR